MEDQFGRGSKRPHLQLALDLIHRDIDGCRRLFTTVESEQQRELLNWLVQFGTTCMNDIRLTAR